MHKEFSIEDLWNSIASSEETFSHDQLSGLPEGARQYLEHAVAPGTRLASGVRLKMHGEIKLKGWLPFKAEQIILKNRDMIWSGTVYQKGLPIRGSDRLLGSLGEMKWRLLGIIPIVSASGHEISRSTAGRVAAESIWLPTSLCGNDVIWTESDAGRIQANFKVCEEIIDLRFDVSNNGRVEKVQTLRWGNPEGAEMRLCDFGGIVEAESTFSGYTIPTSVREGWYFGTERFESEGEFFRVIIDEAVFR